MGLQNQGVGIYNHVGIYQFKKGQGWIFFGLVYVVI